MNTILASIYFSLELALASGGLVPVKPLEAPQQAFSINMEHRLQGGYNIAPSLVNSSYAQYLGGSKNRPLPVIDIQSLYTMDGLQPARGL